MTQVEGKKVINISELLEVFDAQEGEIQSWSGSIGSGKTYGATKRAIKDLLNGKVVYTNWHIDLEGFDADQRNSFAHAFWNFTFFRKRFYKIDIKKNWHYYDLDSSGIVDFISNLTDCTVYADEGQDIFDSYEGTKMSKAKRKSLTRTRHLNKTLVIISQRPQAIAVTARANVNQFFRTIKKLSWPFLYFQVLATEDIDASNMPLWDNAQVVDRYFGNKKIYNAYNSWYLRKGIPKSQEVYFEAYDLTLKQRAQLLFQHCVAVGKRLFSLKRKQSLARGAQKKFHIEKTVGGGSINHPTLKNRERLNTVPVGDKLTVKERVDMSLQQGLPF